MTEAEATPPVRRQPPVAISGYLCWPKRAQLVPDLPDTKGCPPLPVDPAGLRRDDPEDGAAGRPAAPGRTA